MHSGAQSALVPTITDGWSLCEWASRIHYSLECPFMRPFVWSQKTLQVVLGRSSPSSSLAPSFLFLLFLLFLFSNGLRWLHFTLSIERRHMVMLTSRTSCLAYRHGAPRDCVCRPRSLPGLPRGPRFTCGQPLWASLLYTVKEAGWPIPS